MFQTRDEIRRYYQQVWSKLHQGQLLEPMEAIVADVIELHPEYHALLDSGPEILAAEFTPESGQSNPFLHMGMHITLREQAGADRPPGFGEIYRKLITRMNSHDAEHAMIECLAQSLWQAQQNDSLPDEQAYLECLKKI